MTDHSYLRMNLKLKCYYVHFWITEDDAAVEKYLQSHIWPELYISLCLPFLPCCLVICFISAKLINPLYSTYPVLNSCQAKLASRYSEACGELKKIYENKENSEHWTLLKMLRLYYIPVWLNCSSCSKQKKEKWLCCFKCFHSWFYIRGNSKMLKLKRD